MSHAVADEALATDCLTSIENAICNRFNLFWSAHMSPPCKQRLRKEPRKVTSDLTCRQNIGAWWELIRYAFGDMLLFMAGGEGSWS